MTSKSRSRLQRLLIYGVVALALLLLLGRLFVYVFGHGHLGDHARPHTTVPASRSIVQPVSWSDSFADGTPDFLRLADPADQSAFRQWFTLIAGYQAIRPKADVPAEIADCAGLLRYAYREALKRHDDAWFLATGIEVLALPGEIRAWHYPDTPLGANLFRVRPGPFEQADLASGAFAQFADAKTLVELNSSLVTRDVHQARPGDLLFFHQFGRSSPWHSMIVLENSAVVYHTGPDASGPSPARAGRHSVGRHEANPGQIRLVSIADLLDHPQPQWRPTPANPNFLGVYRWNILRGTP